MMILNGIPESQNYTDDTNMPKMLKLLLSSNPYSQFNNSDLHGSYSDWLNSKLKNLSPQDRYLMQSRGFNLNDIDQYHNMLRGTAPDPTIPFVRN